MKKKANSQAAKVASITRAAVAIVPPDGWTLRTPFGMQRLDATDTGRLVRLADVVSWLMEAPRELPCSVAVEKVCTSLEASGAVEWLCLLQESSYAKPLSVKDSFAYVPGFELGASEPEPSRDDIGLAGAVKYMRSHWGTSSTPDEVSGYGAHLLAPLAIRLDKAAELWGYGLGAAPVPDAAPVTEKTIKERLIEARRIRLESGVRGWAALAAKDVGLEPRKAGHILNPQKVKKTKATTLQNAWGGAGSGKS